MKSAIRQFSFKKIKPVEWKSNGLNALLKKIFALTFLFLFSLKAFAQVILVPPPPPYEPRFHFGLQITPSIVWLKADNPLPPALQGNGSNVGFAFGLMTEFAITRNYSFATGIDISYRGGNLKTDSSIAGASNSSTEAITSYNYSLEYIEIPLTLKMKTNEIGYFTYFGQFGLAPGINISSKGDIHRQTQTTDSLGRAGSIMTTDANGVDVSNNINSFNLSLVISIGLEYSLGGSTTALAAITFNNGFLNVLAGGDKAISNSLGVKLGVLF